jgi:hypothetical protein
VSLLRLIIVIDLLATLGLVALVAMLSRRSRVPTPWMALMGVTLFVSFCLALIYGGAWLLLFL